VFIHVTGSRSGPQTGGQDQARTGSVRAFSGGVGQNKLITTQLDVELGMAAGHSTDSTAKIAVVTGGSRGLGRNTVLHLAKRGVSSIFTYRANQAEAENVVNLVAAEGQRAVALQLDTGKVNTFGPFVEQLRASLGDLGAERFDYLVNNAGTSHHNAFEQTTEEELDSLYTVHFKGVFFLTQKLLPLIHDGGRIVNISSGLTRFAYPGSASYASMKGAVEVLTRYLAKELGPRRIAVNTVAPGAVATDFSGGMVRDNPDVNKLISEATALGRVGLPDDIGPMIASLLSEDNRWVNAQRIEVSGGMLI
jgi:NAD(P)-dependent dehydrogenase (short-subunit alcohol dehydrogenase family)